MLFSSFIFLFAFLPVVVSVNEVLCRRMNVRAAQVWLLIGSWFFYAFARPSHLLILVSSIVANWGIVNAMVTQADPVRRRLWLGLGLVANIGLLATFKYVNFGLSQVNLIFGSDLAIPNWDFPLGISFFTLTQVMYLVDCYQGLSSPVSLFNQASAVSFFPAVSSGPIIKVTEVSRQLSEPITGERRLQLAQQGLFLFVLGLAKKVIFADTFANVANSGFAAYQSISSLEAWAFSLAYTFQIYFDFSGYSDMAVGSAWLLGVQIPQNFKVPYTAQSISEFWQRWHISLSNFITNYLYTPVLRSFRKATLRTSAVATLLAMGIAGLWHGPAWNFVMFGVIHGIALACNQFWKKSKRRLPTGVGWFLTFLLVNSAFIVFRSPDLGAAWKMLVTLFHSENPFGTSLLSTVVPLTLGIFAHPLAFGLLLPFVFKSSWEMALEFKPTLLRSLATAGLLVICLYFLNSSVSKHFVYFAF
jgi:alginate O-acetyltransferase complex protein AlgI